jgi:hypothetical protein
MYDCILEEIPTTVKHDKRKAEIDQIFAGRSRDRAQRQYCIELAELTETRRDCEGKLLVALQSQGDVVVTYTMMPDEQIVERLSYLAMEDAHQKHPNKWEDFLQAYDDTMYDWTRDIYNADSNEPSEFEAMMDAADVAYDNANN